MIEHCSTEWSKVVNDFSAANKIDLSPVKKILKSHEIEVISDLPSLLFLDNILDEFSDSKIILILPDEQKSFRSSTKNWRKYFNEMSFFQWISLFFGLKGPEFIDYFITLHRNVWKCKITKRLIIYLTPKLECPRNYPLPKTKFQCIVKKGKYGSPKNLSNFLRLYAERVFCIKMNYFDKPYSWFSKKTDGHFHEKLVTFHSTSIEVCCIRVIIYKYSMWIFFKCIYFNFRYFS